MGRIQSTIFNAY